jgi:hypothetical protein
MQPGKLFVVHLCILFLLFMAACEYEDVPPSPTATARPEFTGSFELQANLAQTISDGALSYTLKAVVPFKIAWSEENKLWKITGEDQKAQGIVTLTGGSVNCTGALTGDVEIAGFVYPEKYKPCVIKFSIFQNWSDATLTCTYSFPFTYTQEIPNGSAAFTISDDFNYSATAGYHSKQVSYTSGILTGILQLKMKSFSGTLIDGCGVTY